MSFSKEIKAEILSKRIEDDMCALSFLGGIFSASAKIDLSPAKIVLGTELEALGGFIGEIIERLYGEKIEIERTSDIKIKGEYFKITLEGDYLERLLADTGLVEVKDFKLQKKTGIDEYLILGEDELKSYVSGVFVGAGTSSIKINNAQRASTGYHLEFASKNYELLCGLGHILAQFDIFAKLVKRKNNYILYVKDAQEVSNVLALIGAYDAVIELQNEMAVREVRNKVNRQTNCMSANISKTVDASFRQNDAISYIVSTVGLDTLGDDLQNVALLRMANPEESLSQLCQLANFEITKSALAYKLNKITKFAEKLKEQNEK